MEVAKVIFIVLGAWIGVGVLVLVVLVSYYLMLKTQSKSSPSVNNGPTGINQFMVEENNRLREEEPEQGTSTMEAETKMY